MHCLREYRDRIMNWPFFNNFPSLSGHNNTTMGCQKNLTHSAPSVRIKKNRPTLLRLNSMGDTYSDEDLSPDGSHGIPESVNNHMMGTVFDEKAMFHGKKIQSRQPQPMESHQKYMDMSWAMMNFPLLRYHPRMDPKLYPQSYGLIPRWQPTYPVRNQQPKLAERLSEAYIGPLYDQGIKMKPCPDACHFPKSPQIPSTSQTRTVSKGTVASNSPSPPLLTSDDKKTLDSVNKLVDDFTQMSVSTPRDCSVKPCIVTENTPPEVFQHKLCTVMEDRVHCAGSASDQLTGSEVSVGHSSKETPTICDNLVGVQEVAPAVSDLCDNSLAICTVIPQQTAVSYFGCGPDTASDSGIDTSADPIEDPYQDSSQSTPVPIKMTAHSQTPHTIPKKKKKSRPSVKKRRQMRNRNEPLKPPVHQVKRQKTENSSSSACASGLQESERHKSATSVSVVLGMLDGSESDENNDDFVHICTKISFLISPSQSDSDDDISWDDEDDDDQDKCLDDMSLELFASFECSFTPTPLMPKCASAPDLLDPNSIEAVNKRWHQFYCDTPTPSKNGHTKPKVYFNTEPTIHPIIAWSYAYQAARKGPWERYATDRFRFKNRINDVQNSIKHIFTKQHRDRIFQERFAGR